MWCGLLASIYLNCSKCNMMLFLIGLSLGLPLWSRVKYFSNYWMDCNSSLYLIASGWILLTWSSSNFLCKAIISSKYSRLKTSQDDLANSVETPLNFPLVPPLGQNYHTWSINLNIKIFIILIIMKCTYSCSPDDESWLWWSLLPWQFYPGATMLRHQGRTVSAAFVRIHRISYTNFWCLQDKFQWLLQWFCSNLEEEILEGCKFTQDVALSSFHTD